MAIEVISIGSSSSGNSYIISAGGHHIILDVGLTAKKINAAMEQAGIAPEDVAAVLVTHEHVDHIKSVRAIGKKCCNAVFIASRGTVEHTENFKYIPEERLRIVSPGDEITITSEYFDNCNDVTIRTFALSHDASEPVSYTFTCGGEKLAVVTDTGIITDEIYEAIHDADMLVFEANHDEDLLMFGEYPYPVKVRIKGDHGHLSNKYAGEVLAKLLTERYQYIDIETSSDISDGQQRPVNIMLAHLSFHNNAPFCARTPIESILAESGFERDVHYTLSIAAKDEISIM